MSKNINFKKVDKYIGCLELSREPLNALSSVFLEEIHSIIKKINIDNECRVLIIKSGLKNFSVGADLKERKIMSKSESHKALEIFNNCFNAIEDIEIPTICLINGYCLGGGTELSLSCDIRVASENAIIGLPETSIGIIPGAGGTFRLSKAIGLQNSKYWIFTAKKFSAKESLKYGFLHKLVNENVLFECGLKIANDILKNAPIAVKSSKKAINENLFLNDRLACIENERMYYNKTLLTKDRDEALDAFINKRKPIWKNE